jgi:hypothetical protein
LRTNPVILSLLLAFPLLAAAQDEGLPVHGTFTLNQRFVDISGREQKYREFFNLQRGPAASLELFGKPRASRFVDSYGVDIYGVGSDRYSGGQMRVGKTGRWDLRVNYRESAYFWNRNDAATQPTGLQGLTTNHDWDTERRFGSLHFSARATEALRFTFDYDRNTRTGVQFTTRVLDYFGAAGTFASFQRANPYEVGSMLSDPGNVDDALNRFTGGVNYTVKRWNIFYKAGFQQFRERLTLENLRSPQRSINRDEAATANELLTTARWDESRRLRAPLSELSYNGQPFARLKLRGSYIFYRYSGPASLDAAFTGTSRANGSGTIVAPYTITETDRATVKEPNHVIDQGFTIQATSKLNVHADYRYSRFTIHSDGNFQGVNNGVTTTGTAEHEWRSGLHQLDLALEFMPRRDLVIRPGIRLSKRDITVEDDGIADPLTSKRSKIVAPIGSIAYTPTDRLSLRADFQNTTNGSPYTRISPRTDRTFRFTGRFALNRKLRIENNSYFRNGRYTTTEFENSFRSSGMTVTYDVIRPVALFGGFTYDSFFATAAVTFLRGTAPLNTTWRDQTVNRIWQAGIDASPVAGLELRIAGNYLRTTGSGEISGERPISGPLTWPMFNGTASYNFPRIGRLALDLQRTYYIEELMTGDNFGAGILSLRWSKDF